jgi:hypothetical protein
MAIHLGKGEVKSMKMNKQEAAMVIVNKSRCISAIFFGTK